MKIKHLLVLLMSFLLLIFIIAPCGSLAAEYRWRLSTQANPDTDQFLDIEEAIERIQTESNGKIQITLNPSGQLGTFGEVYELVTKGLVEMAVQPFDTFLDPQLDMNEIPYLCANYDQATTMLHPDAYLNQVMAKVHDRLDVHLFGLYGIGFGGVGFGPSVKTLPEGIFDPTIVKTTQMRIPETDLYRWVSDSLNFKMTTSLPIMEVFTALQTGMVDGYFGSTPLLAYQNFRDVTKHFVMYNAFVNSHGIIMNKAIFDGLPQDLQTIVSNAMKDLSVKSINQMKSNDEDAIKLLEDYGATVYFPSDDQLNTIASIVREDIWPKLRNQYGEEVIDGLLASLENIK